MISPYKALTGLCCGRSLYRALVILSLMEFSGCQTVSSGAGVHRSESSRASYTHTDSPFLGCSCHPPTAGGQLKPSLTFASAEMCKEAARQCPLAWCIRWCSHLGPISHRPPANDADFCCQAWIRIYSLEISCTQPTAIRSPTRGMVALLSDPLMGWRLFGKGAEKKHEGWKHLHWVREGEGGE